MTKVFLKSFISISAYLCANINCYADKLTKSQIDRLSQSVVRIFSNQKIGSGFIYTQGKYAVTAYHVIAGTSGIVKVQYPSLGDQLHNGKVIKTLKEADLALIEIDGFRNVTPLKISNHSPAFDAQFTTIGFLWDAPTSFSRTINKRDTKILSSLIPTVTKNDIRNAGCPSLELSVYSFENNPLVPGYSGAPIFHSDEGIIGIGDGGIKDGLASVSWAIPTTHLNTLMTSSEYALGRPINSQSHFGADVITNPEWETETVKLGTKEFAKVRSEYFANIATVLLMISMD